MNKKLIKLWSIIGVVGLLGLITLSKSCTVIAPTERGIKVTLGVADDNVLEPGLKWKAPFITEVLKYDLTPIQYNNSFSTGSDGAVTLDKQTIGVTFELFWRYSGSELYTVATEYKTKESLYQPISTSLKEIIKDAVGKKSISDIISNQSALSSEVEERLMTAVDYLPITIDKFAIVNLDWSAEYDRQIEETAKLSQQVEQAKQQALIVEAQAQKQVKEAQAKLEAQKLASESLIVKADGEATAKKKEADALAYYNAKVAQNYQVEIRLKELEIELERAKKWNGVEVPQYIPLTPAGGVVTLPSK